MTKFTFARLPDWAAMCQRRLDAIVGTAAERVAEQAQLTKGDGGRMPVDEGNLRGSFRATLNGGSPIVGPESYDGIAALMSAGDTATFTWGGESQMGVTVDYARHVNYGTSRMAGAHFLEHAVDQWNPIVQRVVGEVEREIKL